LFFLTGTTFTVALRTSQLSKRFSALNPDISESLLFRVAAMVERQGWIRKLKP
jgi:hypothetical protein